MIKDAQFADLLDSAGESMVGGFWLGSLICGKKDRRGRPQAITPHKNWPTYAAVCGRICCGMRLPGQSDDGILGADWIHIPDACSSVALDNPISTALTGFFRLGTGIPRSASHDGCFLRTKADRFLQSRL